MSLSKVCHSNILLSGKYLIIGCDIIVHSGKIIPVTLCIIFGHVYLQLIGSDLQGDSDHYTLLTLKYGVNLLNMPVSCVLHQNVCMIFTATGNV